MAASTWNLKEACFEKGESFSFARLSSEGGCEPADEFLSVLAYETEPS